MGRRPRKRRRCHAAGAAEEGPDCFSHLNEDLLRVILSRLPDPLRHHAHRRVLPPPRAAPAPPPPPPAGRPGRLAHPPRAPLTGPSTGRPAAPPPPPRSHPAPPRPALVLPIRPRLRRPARRLRARLPPHPPRAATQERAPLAVLALDTCAVPRWSNVACPCLRTLKLHRVAIHQETINKVLAFASCLETLEMLYCTRLGTDNAGGSTVESSSARNLVFRPLLKQEETTIGGSGPRTVTLYTRAKTRRLQLAPALEVRKAYLHIAENISLSGFGRSWMLARDWTASHSRGHAMRLLSSEYKDIPKLMVMFQDLRTLSASLDLTSEQELVFLLKLLESCPNLQ